MKININTNDNNKILSNVILMVCKKVFFCFFLYIGQLSHGINLGGWNCHSTEVGKPSISHLNPSSSLGNTVKRVVGVACANGA